MSWRTVVVSQRSKLDLRLGYMVIRNTEEVKIHISEILIVIIENTAVSLTAALLSELIRQKVKVIFCDEKRNPCSELIPYYGSFDTTSKIKNQIEWNPSVNELIWTEIVKNKIINQKSLLENYNKKGALSLNNYLKELEHNDRTNREGHAAKVYFNDIFGPNFSRKKENPINAALNYGYGIILSSFNREIVSSGYITQLGIAHRSKVNQFNLACDLMEPFRMLVDSIVLNMDFETFETEEKREVLQVLNLEVEIDGCHQFVSNAIKIYTKSVLDSLCDQDLDLLRFYTYEF